LRKTARVESPLELVCGFKRRDSAEVQLQNDYGQWGAPQNAASDMLRTHY
jgi:hypothetical protein